MNFAGGDGAVRTRLDAVERLWASLRISVPGGKGLGQRPSALHHDPPGAGGVCPSKLTQMPFGEAKLQIQPGLANTIAVGPRAPT